MKLSVISAIGRKKYDYYGGKRDLIQLLIRKEIAKRQLQDGVCELTVSINELRLTIKDQMMGWNLVNTEIVTALLADTDRPDGDVVLSRSLGKGSISFHNRELLNILELVYSMLRTKKNPATKPPELKLAA